MSAHRPTRRDLLTFGAPFVQGKGAGVAPARVPPLDELVNVLEFEEAAKLTLDRTAFTLCAGSHRDAFDRMTLWPRVLVDSAPLSLAVDIFGQQMFAPLIVGPVAEQRRFHADGEKATVQGAAAANAAVVLSSRSSYPIEEIGAHAKTALWYQVYLDRAISEVRAQMTRGVKAGCRAVCLTVGSAPASASARGALDVRPDWLAVERLSQAVDVPVLLKGVMTPADARRAVESGVKGIVVSNGGRSGARRAPIEVLTAIVAAVESRVPVLIDGCFRRGSDLIKALALGARAVLVARPVTWGLAAYGADGVRAVLQLLQRDLARTMVNVGMPTIERVDRTLVKIHTRPSS